MSVFAYVGRDANGRRVQGHVAADSPKAARLSLAGRNVTAERVDAEVHCKLPPAARRAAIYGELGVLLGSGFTLEKALSMLAGEGGGDPFILSVREAVCGGMSLSEALSVVAPSLPQYEISTLRAAEGAGFQGGMLASLGEFLEARRKVADKVRSSLAYPSLVFILAMGMLSLMLYVVLPRATAMFARMGAEMPPSATLLAAWGPRLMTMLLVLMAAVAAFSAYARSRSSRDVAFAAHLESLALRTPVLGDALRNLWAHRFAGTMALLLGAGTTPQSALPVASAATGSALVGSMASDVERDVRGGQPLSAALAAIQPLGPLISEWVKVGESSGSLSTMLSRVSDKCRQNFDGSLARFIGFLEPALVIVLGAVVLVVAVSVLHPVLEMAGGAIGRQ